MLKANNGFFLSEQVNLAAVRSPLLYFFRRATDQFEYGIPWLGVDMESARACVFRQAHRGQLRDLFDLLNPES